MVQPWWLSGLERVSYSSRHSHETLVRILFEVEKYMVTVTFQTQTYYTIYTIGL